MHRTVLTIAGSDPSGGAGIQADIKAIAANGGYAAAAISALTAQNTRGVIRAEAVEPGMLRAQIDAVLSDMRVVAVKTGMLASAASVAVVAELLESYAPPCFVCDPVLVATSGDALSSPKAVVALQERLLPLATVVTPNAGEAARLAGVAVRSVADAVAAGETLVQRGARAALITGGHLETGAGTDVLVTHERTQVFPDDWVDTPHTHGTGCLYAAAIATQLGHGLPLVEAIGVAKTFIAEAIREGFAIGQGAGPPNPFFLLKQTLAAQLWRERLQDMAGVPL